MSDPVADLLSRIRNAVALGKAEVKVPMSKLRFSLLEILIQQGYIADAKVNKEVKPTIVVSLRSTGKAELKPILGLKKISKPGRRVYVRSTDIPTIRQGQGIAIISTSQGLMVAHGAKARKLGGELLCEVW